MLADDLVMCDCAPLGADAVADEVRLISFSIHDSVGGGDEGATVGGVDLHTHGCVLRVPCQKWHQLLAFGSGYFDGLLLELEEASFAAEVVNDLVVMIRLEAGGREESACV